VKTPLVILGVVALTCGLLFVGQGAGWIRWPASSFMIKETRWIYYGAGIELAVLVLILAGRR
jgi:hypothetical protein